MKTTYWLSGTIISCWLTLVSAQASVPANDAVQSGVQNKIVDVYSTAAVVPIPRTRQFILKGDDRDFKRVE